MRWPSTGTLLRVATRVGLPVGAIGTGTWVAVGQIDHGPMSIIAAAVVSALGFCLAAAPKIIKARSEASVARANAETDAEVRKLYAATRTYLLVQGVERSKVDQVARMLEHQLLDPSLPKDQRLNDRTIIEVAKKVNGAIEASTPAAPANMPGDSAAAANGVVINLPTED